MQNRPFLKQYQKLNRLNTEAIKKGTKIICSTQNSILKKVQKNLPETLIELGTRKNNYKMEQYLITDNRQIKRKPLQDLSFFKSKNIDIIINNPVTKDNVNKADVFNIPLSEINVNELLFQQRKDAFSKRSVDNIIKAVNNGTFKIEIFDPVLLWRNPADGKLYILSGHSRTQAFRILSKKFPQFSTIPAKIIDVSESEAIEIARKSNTLATKESDVERAMYYYKKRKNGTPEKDIKEECKELEGKESNRIYAYSFLSPTGIVIQALEQLDKGDVQSRSTLQTIAKWIGSVRQRYPFLTNIHESEMFRFLTIEGGFGNKPGQFSNENTFVEKINYLILRENIQSNPDNLLNLKNLQQKSSFMKEYEQRLYDAENNLKIAKKELDEKRTKFLRSKVPADKLEELLKPYNMQVIKFQNELIAMKNQYDKVLDAEKSQTSLFGTDEEKAQALIDQIILNDADIYNNLIKCKLLLESIKKTKPDYDTIEIQKKLEVINYYLNRNQTYLKNAGFIKETRTMDNDRFARKFINTDISKLKPSELKTLATNALKAGFTGNDKLGEPITIIVTVIVIAIVAMVGVWSYVKIKQFSDVLTPFQKDLKQKTTKTLQEMQTIYESFTPEEKEAFDKYVSQTKTASTFKGAGIALALIIGFLGINSLRRLK